MVEQVEVVERAGLVERAGVVERPAAGERQGGVAVALKNDLKMPAVVSAVEGPAVEVSAVEVSAVVERRAVKKLEMVVCLACLFFASKISL